MSFPGAAGLRVASTIPRVSTTVLIIIIVFVVVDLFVLGGYLATRKRDRLQASHFDADVAAADQALELARADDRGWDQALLEAAARRALEAERPGESFEHLMLVLVDDQPGKDEDKAHFMAIGDGSGARVVLARQGDHWSLDRVEAAGQPN